MAVFFLQMMKIPTQKGD